MLMRNQAVRRHLQEVPVGQHHLEPHFFLEDPKNKNSWTAKHLYCYCIIVAKSNSLLIRYSLKQLPWTLAVQEFLHDHLDQEGPVGEIRGISLQSLFHTDTFKSKFHSKKKRNMLYLVEKEYVLKLFKPNTVSHDS